MHGIIHDQVTPAYYSFNASIDDNELWYDYSDLGLGDAGAIGAWICADADSVVPIPEPATILLLFFGFHWRYI